MVHGNTKHFIQLLSMLIMRKTNNIFVITLLLKYATCYYLDKAIQNMNSRTQKMIVRNDIEIQQTNV